MQQQPVASSTPSLQNQAVRTSDQHSPGQQIKLQDHNIETNHAFAEKTNPPPTPISNNLLIMANEHREFSSSSSVDNQNNNNNSNNVVVPIINTTQDENNKSVSSESDESPTKSEDSAESDVTKCAKNANLTVATNIANAFINIATSNTKNPNVQTKNLNVIVTQQNLSQHIMKTLSFASARGGIFVPNVIATNVTPQFTVHQYGLHGNNPHGPAPNVTVNPNGNFNSNSNAIRPGTQSHFRLLFQQTPNINLNIINNQASQQQVANPVQTFPKAIPAKTIIQNPSVTQKSQMPVVFQSQQRPSSADENSNVSININNNNAAADNVVVQQDVQNVNNNDQSIRVLTPSEIMKTLPSLTSQDNVTYNSGNITNTQYDNNSSSSSSPANVEQSSVKNSSTTNSPPITAITSECNTLSSNFVTSTTITTTTSTITKATLSSNNAPLQSVSGYKTYKNIKILEYSELLFQCLFFSFSKYYMIGISFVFIPRTI